MERGRSPHPWLTEDEMLGQSIDRIFTEDDLAVDRPAIEMQCALETGSANDERWHMRQGGECFWANGQLTLLRDEAGAAVGFVKVLRDRTEQRLATETLRGTQADIRLLLDGFYAVDTEGLPTVCNAAFLRLMGFAREVRRRRQSPHKGRPSEGQQGDDASGLPS